MRKLYSPRNEIELALIRSLLDGERIQYYVHNDHFGSMYAGPVIGLYNSKTLMVAEKDFLRAEELLADYLRKAQPETPGSKIPYTFLDKIRMLFEVLLFGWIMPGRRKKR